MAYSAWSVVAGEIPTASKWNLLGSNDASFNDGTGIGTEAILSSHLAPVVIQKMASSNVTVSNTSAVDITGCSISVTPSIASTALVWATIDWTATTVGAVAIGELDVDGAKQAQSLQSQESTNSERGMSAGFWIVALTAAAHTLKLTQKLSAASGTYQANQTHTKIGLLLIGDNNATYS